MKTLRIAVEYIHPPIPLRQYDWCVRLADVEPEAGDIRGYGDTKAAAISNFLDQWFERYEGKIELEVVS